MKREGKERRQHYQQFTGPTWATMYCGKRFRHDDPEGRTFRHIVPRLEDVDCLECVTALKKLMQDKQARILAS